MTAPATDVLAEMVRRIVDGFAPERILLFGSRARGNARPDSDYDLLVVLDACPNRRTAAVAIGSCLADLPASKDILVATAAEVRTAPVGCSIIVREALKEGRAVYERS